MADKYKPREFVVKDAVREAGFVKAGLFSPSGGGKTYSALRLATGIQSVVGGDIVFIDTENRRGTHYADLFKFKHIDFRAPFSSRAYLDAMRAAAKAGSIIVVDSMSHEHEGEGGMLAYQEAEVDRMAGDDFRKREAMKMLAWAKPKADRKLFLNQGILGVQAHMVLCFRAKSTAKPVKVTQEDGRTKTEVVQQGFMPIAGDEFVWEMDLAALFMPGAQGVPTWSSENPGEAMMIKVPKVFESVRKDYKDKPLDEALGAKLAKWAVGGAKAAPRKEEPTTVQERPAADSSRPTSRVDAGKVAEPAKSTQAGQPAGDLLDQAQDRPSEPETPKADPPADPEPETPTGPQGFGEYAEAMVKAKTWRPDVVELLAAFVQTQAYLTADTIMQGRARSIAFMQLQAINEARSQGTPFIDFLDDMQAFRCYIEAETDLDALVGNDRAFQATPIWAAQTAETHGKFRMAVERRAAAITAASSNDEYS